MLDGEIMLSVRLKTVNVLQLQVERLVDQILAAAKQGTPKIKDMKENKVSYCYKTRDVKRKRKKSRRTYGQSRISTDKRKFNRIGKKIKIVIFK